MKVMHHIGNDWSARCGAKFPNRSQFTGNPNLAPTRTTEEWEKVTCKRCQNTYVTVGPKHLTPFAQV